MEKYIINDSIHGYKELKIGRDRETIEEIREGLVYILIDNTVDSQLGEYYTSIRNMIKRGNRVILIGVRDDNKSFRLLASLMVSYDSYDIYEVDSIADIAISSLAVMEEREPDALEVQTYIGGDVTSYSDLSTIIFAIETLVDEGKEEELRRFIEDNEISIENIVYTLDSMKKICNQTNTGEINKLVNKMKDEKAILEEQLSDKKSKIEDLNYEISKQKINISDKEKEIKQLKEEKNKLESSNSISEGNGSIIKSFKELNLQMINCKTKVILYFKEISYVQYTNTLVTMLKEFLSTVKKLKVKLLIYDNSTEIFAPYKGLATINGSEYISRKSSVINQIQKMVITEPNQSIIEDILTSEQAFDVVMIYDRMRSNTDIVSGNNVTKYYVINSATYFEEIKKKFRVDIDCVITHAEADLKEEKSRNTGLGYIDIPYMKGFSSKKEKTDSGRLSDYIRLSTYNSKECIFEKIMKRSRISALSNIEEA